MGMRCVAVYVDADADAPFVADADLAVRVDSYMEPAAIVDAARRAGADAIHPGYGFLSENAGFARAVIDAGLTWVGPSPDVIAAMGDKLEAKRRAVSAGVPTLPSTDDSSDGDAVGYPLLVKAAAGGGGKGMRVVEAAADLDDAVAAAQREALKGFGDDTVFLERFIAASRHIEIQIMGLADGTVIHHGERECSIQRRHQKIVEEAPSPAVTAELRAEMGAAAVSLGTELGYRSAGTVEFLVDEATKDFYFLEVNTRLQVEHPVTEAITGRDLVADQLLIAMGLPPDDTPPEPAAGHAIEVRLYAEDPTNDFLPATGIVAAFEPAESEHVRFDVGVEAGSKVTVDFDPMLGKIIATGPSRVVAARTLARALADLHFGGVVTNRDFLVNVLRSDAYLDGDTTTDFIERIDPPRVIALAEGSRRRVAVAAAMWLRGRNRAADHHWGQFPAGWRNGRLPATERRLVVDDTEIDLAYRSRRDGSVDLEFDSGDADSGGSAVVKVHHWHPHGIDIEIDALRSTHRITEHGDHLHVQMPETTIAVVVVPAFTVPGSGAPTGGFVAPMPGAVLDVRVAVGDTVVQGQTLVVLEAMKMEHHMTAPEDGTVTEVHVDTGDHVAKDAVLLTMRGVDDDGGASDE
jgi:propionyl-CoA carboxylase alpha chain